MKKKIIFSSYDDLANPYYAGGGAQAIFEVATRIAKDFEVVVITGNYPHAKNTIIQNVTYKRIGLPSFGPKFGQLMFHILLPWYVRKEKFDLWVESFTPPFSTSCLQKFTKKPVIGLVHMLSSEDMERKYKLPFHLIEDRGLKTYNYFIVLTEAFKKKLERVNKHAKIFLIPIGVNDTKLKSTSATPPKQEYVFYIGRLEVDQKGIDLLIQAYASIASTTKAKLIIAGSGLPHEKEALEKMIQHYKLQDRVKLVGKVGGAKKEELLQNASVVVVPSRFETFGTVALEAMLHGKPLVSFDIDGFQWIPNDCILRVTPYDSQKMGLAISRILTDHTLRTTMSQAAVKNVKDYSWEKIGEKYMDVFTTLLK